MPVITLKWPTYCRQCGAPLKSGERAAFYGGNKVYGLTCHKEFRPELRDFPRIEDTFGYPAGILNRPRITSTGGS